MCDMWGEEADALTSVSVAASERPGAPPSSRSCALVSFSNTGVTTDSLRSKVLTQYVRPGWPPPLLGACPTCGPTGRAQRERDAGEPSPITSSPKARAPHTVGLPTPLVN